MKKSLIITALVFCLLVAIVFAVTMTKEQRYQVNECKKGCLNESKIALQLCNDNQNSCLDTCKNESAACNVNISVHKQVCVDTCQLEYNISINHSLDQFQIRNVTNELRLCKRSCTLDANQAKKLCSQTQCRNECGRQKKSCVNERNEGRLACFNSCVDAVLAPLNSTIPINQSAPQNETQGNGNNNSNACNQNNNPPFCSN